MRAPSIAMGILALTFCELTVAQQVYVRAGSAVGRGLTRKKSGACFVIVPDHVVKSAGTTDIVAFGGAVSQATVEYNDSTNDVAILKVSNPDVIPCDPQWPSPASLDSILARATTGDLLVANEDGGRDTISVKLRSVEKRRIVIEPASQEDHLIQGHSGSLLLVNGQPAGLLLSIESKSGNVFRFDFINGLIAGFFDPGRTIEVSREDVRNAFNRVVKAASDGFLSAKGDFAHSDTASSLEYFDSTIIWPGATESRVAIYEDRPRMPNFITWRYPPFPTVESAQAFYSATNKALTEIVPGTWKVEEFPSSSRPGERHIRAKPIAEEGPVLDVIFWTSSGEPKVTVSIKAH